MKILYVVTGLGLGGAEKVVVDLAERMSAEDHEVKIVYLRDIVEVWPEEQNISLIPLHFNSIFNFFSALRQFRKIIRQFNPDVVHAHMIHANIFARLSRLITPMNKLICTAHSSNEGGALKMLTYRITHKLSDLTTNVSDEAANTLVFRGAAPKDGILTVYNGIDLNKFKPFKENKELSSGLIPRLLAVGRLNEAKDYPNLLKTLFILKERGIDFQLKIAGDGELRSEIKDLIISLDLTQNVELLGKRLDIPDLLSQSDFFILSSRFEGLPTVVIEAMSSGAFVIATDCGGVKEVMGDTGIIVEPGNSLALADAIQQAFRLEPEELSFNNIKARKRVENLFSLDVSVQNWYYLYTQP